jgi:hypothetical protein
VVADLLFLLVGPAEEEKLSATSPSEIHIFSPFRIQSSPSRFAYERIPTTSEPAFGSVSPNVAIFSPFA